MLYSRMQVNKNVFKTKIMLLKAALSIRALNSRPPFTPPLPKAHRIIRNPAPPCVFSPLPATLTPSINLKLASRNRNYLLMKPINRQSVLRAMQPMLVGYVNIHGKMIKLYIPNIKKLRQMVALIIIKNLGFLSKRIVLMMLSFRTIRILVNS